MPIIHLLTMPGKVSSLLEKIPDFFRVHITVSSSCVSACHIPTPSSPALQNSTEKLGPDRQTAIPQTDNPVGYVFYKFLETLL